MGCGVRRAWVLAAAIAVCVLLGVAACAAFMPVPASASREQPFVIPKGTFARRMAGEQVEILPQQIRLTLGVNDILRLTNQDTVPQTFGPALLMPGQSFRLPFEQASEYDFVCSAHASGSMKVIVDPFPATPWGRLRWRTLKFLHSFSNRSHEPHS